VAAALDRIAAPANKSVEGPMKYKMFTGQGSDIEKKINDWITPNIEVCQTAQSSILVQINDKTIPYTMISVFYKERGNTEGRQVE